MPVNSKQKPSRYPKGTLGVQSSRSLAFPTANGSNDAPRFFDCFLLHDELDLLELRLGELWDSVDQFVLVESTLTFSGLDKPLYFHENRERFRAFSSKLTAIVADDPESGLTAWQRREVQCNALVQGLARAKPSDVVLLSDVDEIVSPTAIRKIRRAPPESGEVICCELRMFNFFLNLEIDEHWLRSGPRAARFGDIKTMERLRKVLGPSDRRWSEIVRALKASLQMGQLIRRRVIRGAGWHFSYVGNEEAIGRKLRAYAGHTKVPLDLLAPDGLAARVRDRRSISKMGSGQLNVRALDDTFPAYLLAHRDRFAHLIAPDEAEGAAQVTGYDA